MGRIITVAMIAIIVAIDQRRAKGDMFFRYSRVLALACFLVAGFSRSGSAAEVPQASPQSESSIGVVPPVDQGPSMVGTPPPGAPFAGCSMDLPSGVDRDAGLSQQYLSDQEGRDVVIAPMLSAREVYSDNVTLAPRGRQSPDFVTDLMPGLTVCQQAPRITSHFHYQMDALYYAEHQNRNAIFNAFNGSAHTVILKNHLFFDASTDYGQAIINPAQPYSLDPALDVGNRTNAWTFSLSPYWVQSLGPLGISTIRYSYNRALYNDPALPAYYSNSGSFNLVNPPHNGSWSWEAVYQTSQLVYQGNYRPNYMDTAALQLGYKVSSHLQLLGQGGVEDKYLPDGAIRRLHSPFWNGGIRWTDRMTSLELRFGHRFFGKSYYARLVHHGKHLTVSISYREAPEIASLNNAGGGLYGISAAGGIPGAPIGLTSPTGQSLLPFRSLFDNRIYLSKSLNGSITYRTGRSTIHVDGFRIRDRYLQTSTVFSGTQQDTTGGGAYWRWQLQPRLFVIPRISYVKDQFSSGQIDYLTTEYLSLALLLSPTTQAGITLEHQQRLASVPTSSYRENAVVIEFTKIF